VRTVRTWNTSTIYKRISQLMQKLDILYYGVYVLWTREILPVDLTKT